jgi:repressor of nif and glnA expression
MIKHAFVDKVILSQLGKNARISSLQIAYTLKNMGYDITDRSIRHRLERLQKKRHDTWLLYNTSIIKIRLLG